MRYRQAIIFRKSFIIANGHPLTTLILLSVVYDQGLMRVGDSYDGGLQLASRISEPLSIGLQAYTSVLWHGEPTLRARGPVTTSSLSRGGGTEILTPRKDHALIVGGVVPFPLAIAAPQPSPI